MAPKRLLRLRAYSHARSHTHVLVEDVDVVVVVPRIVATRHLQPGFIIACGVLMSPIRTHRLPISDGCENLIDNAVKDQTSRGPHHALRHATGGWGNRIPSYR